MRTGLAIALCAALVAVGCGTSAPALDGPPPPETGPGNDSTSSALPPGEIVFASDRSGNLDIWWMRLDTRETRNLTRHRAKDIYPAWSPDGSQIAFTSTRNGRYDVFVMNADGTNVVNLTRTAQRPDGTKAHDWMPEWSPDGQWLAFASDRSGSREIWIIKPDGTGARRLTATDTAEHPDWAPDGRTLLLGSFNGTTDVSIYRVDVETGQVTAWQDTARSEHWTDQHPAQGVAFHWHRDPDFPQRRRGALWVRAPGAADPTLLARCPFDNRECFEAPSWSPDGQWVVFHGNTWSGSGPPPPEPRELFVVNVATGSVKRVTWNTTQDAAPRWRPMP